MPRQGLLLMHGYGGQVSALMPIHRIALALVARRVLAVQVVAIYGETGSGTGSPRSFII
jgi:predicted esterase